MFLIALTLGLWKQFDMRMRTELLYGKYVVDEQGRVTNDYVPSYYLTGIRIESTTIPILGHTINGDYASGSGGPMCQSGFVKQITEWRYGNLNPKRLYFYYQYRLAVYIKPPRDTKNIPTRLVVHTLVGDWHYDIRPNGSDYWTVTTAARGI